MYAFWDNIWYVCLQCWLAAYLKAQTFPLRAQRVLFKVSRSLQIDRSMRRDGSSVVTVSAVMILCVLRKTRPALVPVLAFSV